jgi:hypothetical protein
MEELFAERKAKAQILGTAQAMAADSSHGYHLWIGVPAIIISTIVGTAAFAGVSEAGRTHIWISIVVGMLSVSAAVLTALQTFFNFAVKSQKHADAAARFFALSRRLGHLADKPASYSWRLVEEIEELDEELNDIIKDAPRVSIKLQTKARELIEAERREGREGDYLESA